MPKPTKIKPTCWAGIIRTNQKDGTKYVVNFHRCDYVDSSGGMGGTTVASWKFPSGCKTQVDDLTSILNDCGRRGESLPDIFARTAILGFEPSWLNQRVLL